MHPIVGLGLNGVCPQRYNSGFAAQGVSRFGFYLLNKTLLRSVGHSLGAKRRLANRGRSGYNPLV